MFRMLVEWRIQEYLIIFDENFEKSTLKDIFPHLRKNPFVSNNDEKKFTYVFNSNTRKWARYRSRWLAEKELQIAFKHLKSYLIFCTNKYTN